MIYIDIYIYVNRYDTLSGGNDKNGLFSYKFILYLIIDMKLKQKESCQQLVNSWAEMCVCSGCGYRPVFCSCKRDGANEKESVGRVWQTIENPIPEKLRKSVRPFRNARKTKS